MSGNLEIKIPDKTVEQVVRDHLQTSLLAAMDKDKDRVIDKIVQHAIYGKVKEGYSEVAFIDKLISDVLREECRLILKQWLQDNRAKIAEQMHKAMTRRKTPFTELANAMIDAVTDDWYFKFNVTAGKRND